MDIIMDFLLGRFSIIFLGALVIGYGYWKNKELKKLDNLCDKVIGKIVSFEMEEENYGRYIYEYIYEGRKYRSGLDKLVLKNKKDKVEKNFGKKEALYCYKSNPYKIEKVYNYTSMIAILVGIFIIIFGILFG